VTKGEEVVLAKAGKPLVRMVPFVQTVAPRTPGLMADQGWEAPDCWASSEEKEFEDSIGKPLFHGAVEEPPAGAP
jgi:antitoxin (DNA-binding transcriptional repressor) of toxin-antitoxin stability system